MWCAKCHHSWIVAYLPMDVDRLVLLMQSARCPKCANCGRSWGIFMGRYEDTHEAHMANLREYGGGSD